MTSPKDQAPTDPPREERPSPGPGSRRPSPALVVTVLVGIVLAFSVVAYVVTPVWFG